MPTLSLILPCYNEARRLPAALAAYLAHLPDGPGQVEVLVVDDGSTDGTAAVAGTIAAQDTRVRVLRSRTNHGKGFAVRTGVLAATGDLVVFTDADGSYAPAEVERVLAALAHSPVAIGARVRSGRRARLSRRAASRAFSLALRLVLDLPFRDTQCGLKGFQRAAADQVFARARLDGFAFDAELLVLARQLDLVVAEVPVRVRERSGSKVHVLSDGRRMLAELWAVRRASRTRPPEPGRAARPGASEA
jgi:glycosyltransferase involved in cell wall biosynthesis